MSVAFDSPPDVDPASIADDLIDECDAIVSVRSTGNTPRISIGRAADEALERMTSVMQREGAIGGITWGLRDVDHKTDGLQRGELTIVAGRPGMGKTGVGLGSTLKMALRGYSALYVSLEMMGAALANRCLSDLLFNTKNLVSYWDITRGNLTDTQAGAVVETTREIQDVPLEIEQQAGLEFPKLQRVLASTKLHLSGTARCWTSLWSIISGLCSRAADMPAVELTRSKKRPAG